MMSTGLLERQESNSLLKNSVFARQGPLIIRRLIVPYCLQDAQKGCPARPQRAKRRGVRFGTLSL